MSVLLIAAMALGTALCLGAAASSHLNLALRRYNSQEARCLAESAVLEVVAKIDREIRTNPGKQPTLLTTRDTTDVPAGASQASGSQRYGMVTFDPARIGQCPTSSLDFITDNVTGSALLIGTGFVNGVKRQVEVRLEIPPFPYAVATAGPIETSGNVLVKGQNGTKGNVVSNRSITKKAGTFKVTGDAVCHKLITGLVAKDDVEGHILPNRPAVDLPVYDLNLYQPSVLGFLPENIHEITEQLVTGNLLLGGANFHNGPLKVQGKITLNGGLLYVNGPLEITGGTIMGSGMVVVRGKTTISGADVDIRSNSAKNELALLSEDDIAITGSGTGMGSPKPRMIQGMVYTFGSFRAQHVEIVGSLVLGTHNASHEEESRTLTLDDATLVYDPIFVNITASILTPGFSRGDLIYHGSVAGMDKFSRNTDPVMIERWPAIRDQFDQVFMEQTGDQPFKRILGSKPYHPETFWWSPESYTVGLSGMEIPLTNWREKLTRPEDAAALGTVGDALRRALQIDPGYNQPLKLSLEFRRLPTNDPNFGNATLASSHILLSNNGRFTFDAGSGAPYDASQPGRVYVWAHVQVDAHNMDFKDAQGNTLPQIPGLNSHVIGIEYISPPRPDYQAWRNVVAKICQIYGTSIDEVGGASLQLQDKISARANAILDRTDSAKPGNSATPNLTMNRFLQTSRPLQITAWRER